MLLACANTVRQPVFTRMCILAFLPCRCYGSDMMAREDVAVVCALVLLLRLGRFPEPDGFGELRPLFRCIVYTLVDREKWCRQPTPHEVCPQVSMAL